VSLVVTLCEMLLTKEAGEGMMAGDMVEDVFEAGESIGKKKIRRGS
jgi:hypothetical protein